MSRMHNQYRELESRYNYIDKTECLEKEIERFPSVYIEGAAGCGKTTMMRMFLEKHPEVDYTVLWMDEDEKDEDAWIFYRLARIEYYLKTNRLSSVADEDMQKQWQVLTLPYTKVRRILQNGSKAQLFRRMQRSQKRILSDSTADPKDIFC